MMVSNAARGDWLAILDLTLGLASFHPLPMMNDLSLFRIAPTMVTIVSHVVSCSMLKGSIH